MTDLFFCNFCDQSVPQQQLDDHQAIRHGGRVVCPTCCDTLSMAVRAKRGGGGSGGVLSVVGLVFALGALGGVGYLYQDQSRQSDDLATSLDSTKSDVTREQDAMALESGKRFAALNSELSELRGQLGEQNEQMIRQGQEISQQLATLDQKLEPLNDLQDGQQSLTDDLQRLGARMGLVEDNQRDIRAAQEFLRDGFAQVQREVAAANVPEPASSGFSSEVESLLEKLKADDPLARVDALQKLGNFQDARLIAYVEPLLEDSYEMNRFYAAYTLGEWSSMQSVPRLIPVLEDQFAFVRQSANEALVKITKEDMGFEEKASDSERAKAVSRWADWAKKHEDELVPDASGS